MYFFFFLFAIVGVFSAIMVITRRNVMHAALFLLLTFACVGATYVLLRAEMLAAVQVSRREPKASGRPPKAGGSRTSSAARW